MVRALWSDSNLKYRNKYEESYEGDDDGSMNMLWIF